MTLFVRPSDVFFLFTSLLSFLPRSFSFFFPSFPPFCIYFFRHFLLLSLQSSFSLLIILHFCSAYLHTSFVILLHTDKLKQYAHNLFLFTYVHIWHFLFFKILLRIYHNNAVPFYFQESLYVMIRSRFHHILAKQWSTVISTQPLYTVCFIGAIRFRFV